MEQRNKTLQRFLYSLASLGDVVEVELGDDGQDEEEQEEEDEEESAREEGRQHGHAFKAKEPHRPVPSLVLFSFRAHCFSEERSQAWAAGPSESSSLSEPSLFLFLLRIVHLT